MPTMPATAATAMDQPGTSSCLSFRPVSTALADQPATQMSDPITAATQAAQEPITQAQTSSVAMAMRLPGRTG